MRASFVVRLACVGVLGGASADCGGAGGCQESFFLDLVEVCASNPVACPLSPGAELDVGDDAVALDPGASVTLDMSRSGLPSTPFLQVGFRGGAPGPVRVEADGAVVACSAFPDSTLLCNVPPTFVRLQVTSEAASQTFVALFIYDVYPPNICED